MNRQTTKDSYGPGEVAWRKLLLIGAVLIGILMGLRWLASGQEIPGDPARAAIGRAELAKCVSKDGNAAGCLDAYFVMSTTGDEIEVLFVRGNGESSSDLVYTISPRQIEARRFYDQFTSRIVRVVLPSETLAWDHFSSLYMREQLPRSKNGQ